MNGDFVELEDPSIGFNPTKEDIEDFAKYLGFDLPNDNQLLWIAREGITAKIPPPWKFFQRRDRTTEPFYFNPVTGESQLDHPLYKKYKQLFQQEKKDLLSHSKPKSALKNSSHSMYTNNSNNDECIPKANLTPKQNRERNLEEGGEIPSNIQCMFDDEIDEIVEEHEAYVHHLQEENEAKIKEMERKFSEDFAARVQQIRQECDSRLEQIKNESNKTISDAQSSKLKAQEEVFNNKKKSMENDFAKQKAAMENDFAKQKKSLENEFSSQIESMKQMHNLEVEKKKIEMEGELSKLGINHISKITDIKTQHQKEINDLLNKSNNECNELKEKSAKELERIKKKIKKQVEALRQSNEIEQLKEANEEEKEQLKRIQEREIRRMKRKHEQTVELLKNNFKNEIEDIKSDNSSSHGNKDFQGMKTNYNIKKRSLERKQKEEMEQMEEDHKNEIEKLKSSYNKTIKQLKEELENEKNEYESQKEDISIKKKRELEKAADECNKEINIMREEFQEKKIREKAAFQQEMQLLLSSIETERIRAQSLHRKEMEEMNKMQNEYKNAFREEPQIIREKKRVPLMRFESPPSLSISPIPKPKYYSFSMQKVFSLRPESKPASIINEEKDFIDKDFVDKDDEIIDDFIEKEMKSVSEESTATEVSKRTDFTYFGRSQISVERFEKQRNKVSKLSKQFNSTYNDVNTSMKEISYQNEEVSNDFKSLIAKEHKNIAEASSQFSNQMLMIRKTLNETLHNVESMISTSIIAPSRAQMQIPMRNELLSPQSPSYNYESSSSRSLRRKRKDSFR